MRSTTYKCVDSNSIFVESECSYAHGMTLFRDPEDNGDEYWGGSIYCTILLCPDRLTFWKRLKYGLKFIFSSKEKDRLQGLTPIIIPKQDIPTVVQFLKSDYHEN